MRHQQLLPAYQINNFNNYAEEDCEILRATSFLTALKEFEMDCLVCYKP